MKLLGFLLVILCSWLSSSGLAQHQRPIPVGAFTFRFEAPQLATIPDCYFDRLTVIRPSSGGTVQTIVFDQDMTQSLPCRTDASVMAKVTDANSDGYRDALLLSFAAATNQLYDVWLYRPSIGRFVRVLGGLGMLTK